MRAFRMIYLILPVILFTSTVCVANHFGGGVGGFHPNAGNNGWNHPDAGNNNWNNNYHNNPNVGTYYPGNGWVAPTYIINGSNQNDDCQTEQQCDSNGTCIQTQNCD